MIFDFGWLWYIMTCQFSVFGLIIYVE